MKTIEGTMVWCEACRNVCWIYDENKFGIGEFCNSSEDVVCPVCSAGDAFSAYTINHITAAMSRQTEWIGVLKYAARQFQVKWRSIVVGNALVTPWKPEFEVKGLVDVEHVRSTQERNHSNPG